MAGTWTEIAEMNTDVIPAKLVVNGYEITVNERYFNTISIETGCMQDGYISYGGTFSPSCSVTMQDHELIQNGAFFEVYLQIEGAWEHFGKYKIKTEPKRQQGVVEFSGVGLITSIFDNTIIELNGPDLRRIHSFTEVVEMLSEKTGVEIELAQRPSYIEDLTIMFPGFINETEAGTGRYKSLNYSAREILGGLALFFGGNAVERNGKVYLTLASRSGSSMTKVFTEDAYSDCVVSRKAYAPAPIKLSYQGYTHGVIPDSQNLQYLYYRSGDKKTAILAAEPPSGGITPNELYQLQIDCDWIAYSILELTPSIHNFSWAGAAGAYRPFEAEFCGYHPYIAAGNDITVIDEQGNQQQVFCDNVTYEWDGGMSIKASSSFEVTGGSGGATSTVTSSTAAGGMTAQQIGQQNEVAAFKSIYTNYVEANSAKIGALEVDNETVKGKLEVLGEIHSNAVTTENLNSKIAELGYMKTEKADIKYATIEHLTVLEKEVLKKMGVDELEANIAILGYLKSSEAALAYADITLANIDTANINKEAVGQLFAKIGILQNVTIKNGAVTGELNGVRINGDWIDANTLAADKLILRGKDGLFYEINATCSGLSSTELSDEKYKEAIDGTCIIKKSVTAEQINVDTELVRQLFAHDVTATGTITGAVLKGAEAEVVKGKIGGWLIGGSDIYYEDDYAIFSISAGVSAKTPGLIKLRRKDIANSVNTGYITGLEWYGVMESSNFRRSLYINNDGFVFGIQREGETAAHTTKINLGAVKAGDSVTTPAVYTDKLKLKSTNYGVEIGTTASGGSSGVRIGDLSGGNGSYTYITNDCVAQHGLRVSGNLNVEGKLTLAEKLACAVTVKRTTNQSISSSSETTISLDAVNENQDTDVFKLSGGLLIVQKSGYYLLSGTAVMAATGNNATVKRLRIRDQTNNVELASVISRTVGTYQSFVIPPVLVHLSAYTSVSLTYQDDSGSGTVYGNAKNATHLTALKITS